MRSSATGLVPAEVLISYRHDHDALALFPLPGVSIVGALLVKSRISSKPCQASAENLPAAGSDPGQMRPLPVPGQTLAPARPAEPARLRHRADLRSRIPGHRELLPARPGRLATRRAALERRDIHAEDPDRKSVV